MKANHISNVHIRIESILREMMNLRKEISDMVGSSDLLSHMLFFKEHDLHSFDIDDMISEFTKFRDSISGMLKSQSNYSLWESIASHFRLNFYNPHVTSYISAWELVKDVAEDVPYDILVERCAAAEDPSGMASTGEIAEHIMYNTKSLAYSIDVSRFDSERYVQLFGLMEVAPSTWRQLNEKDRKQYLQRTILAEFILAVMSSRDYDIKEIDAYVG